MASLLIGPTGRNPDYARNEHQYAKITGAQTAVLVAHGGGMVHTVEVGVAGTLAVFHDVESGGSLSAATEIATISLASVGNYPDLDFAFSKGLTVVVTGAGELTVMFRGAQTVSTRTFGTIDSDPNE